MFLASFLLRSTSIVSIILGEPSWVEYGSCNLGISHPSTRDGIFHIEKTEPAAAPCQRLDAILSTFGRRYSGQQKEQKKARCHRGAVNPFGAPHSILAAVLENDDEEEYRVQHGVDDREDIEAAGLAGMVYQQNG